MSVVIRIAKHTTLTGVFVFMLSLLTSAQIFTTLLNFDGTNGAHPEFVTLTQDRSGNLWGTTADGGYFNYGTVFHVTPDGVSNTVLNFNKPQGTVPYTGLTLAKDGSLYGVTTTNGTYYAGTVFKLSSLGHLTILYAFNGSELGLGVEGAPVQGADGNFYGAASSGGRSCGDYTCGTAFKITTSGALTDIYEFAGTYGSAPVGGLVQGVDGNLYGTAVLGGTGNCGNYGCGTIFRLSTSGVFKLLHNFSFSDGSGPNGGLIQGADGNFYGTTEGGGANGWGTVFAITPEGALTTLYNFTDGPDGGDPAGPLVQGSDGNLYGTAFIGGNFSCHEGCGTVFQLTLSGALTTLHSFAGFDGSAPLGGLVQHTNGVFYGTTCGGDFNNCPYGSGDGTVFSLDMGLPPFITFVNKFGRIGAGVQILGQNLTGTTSVTFNGIPATSFSVVSDTFMTAVVPAGATSGPVQVTTPTGTLNSNVNFQVRP